MEYSLFVYIFYNQPQNYFFGLVFKQVEISMIYARGMLVTVLGEKRDATFRIKEIYVFFANADVYSAGVCW